MTSDPPNRKWQDISSDDPHRMNAFKANLVWFLAWDHSKYTKAVGTGFIIGGDKQHAVVFTAKHVFDEATKFQNKNPRQAPSALIEFISPKKLSIEETGLQAIWMDEKKFSMMKVKYVLYADDLDIAYCVLVPDKPDEFLPVHVPLDLQTPSKGDTVHMVTILGKEAEEISDPIDNYGFGLSLKIDKEVSIRRGIVTGVYEKGFNRYKFPCFTTSIPIEGGMSGGFVTKIEDQAVISACGIISGDEFTPLMGDGVGKNQPESLGSVISCVWPALGFLYPVNIYDKSIPKQTIYDVVKSGGIKTFGDSVDQFELIKLGQDDHRVQRKSQRFS